MTEVAQRRPYEDALAEIAQRVEIVKQEGSGFEVAATVADKIMSARTIDDVLAAAEGGPGDLESLVGKTFRFLGGSLSWYEGSEQFREGGTGFYAVFTVRDLRGNDYTISTGATNVVFQLRKLESMGVFENDGELYPYEFTVKVRVTGSGNSLYRISAP